MTLPGRPSGPSAKPTTILNRVLADEFVLYVKTRHAHWNVVGPEFYSLHKLFESQYEALSDVVDDVAERLRALDAMPVGTMADFLRLTGLQEAKGSGGQASALVRDLAADHTAEAEELTAVVGLAELQEADPGTINFLTDLVQKHQKMAWMLKATGGKS